MKKTISVLASLAFVLVISDLSYLNGQTIIDAETGVVFSGYNDVRIPGDQGTLFSLSKELDSSPKVFYRLRAGYTFGTRHNLSLLFAPLNISSNGSIPRDITFEGVVFPANRTLIGFYKFNSYRLTYRYDFIEKPKLEFGLGLTAKIRDASIMLISPNEGREKTNVGFVPLINFMLAWKINDNVSLLIDGDALAAPQGRAEDVLIAVQYKLSDHIGLRAGYRILEGGADNDEVYNFALFNYAAAGLTLSF